jgi:hypothetical protein
MEFSVAGSIELLRSTPHAVKGLLGSLGAGWLEAREGEDSWSPLEVVAHLIVCEQTNWIPRLRAITWDGGGTALQPIDMSAHFELASGCPMAELLERFSVHRAFSLSELQQYRFRDADLDMTGVHPSLGAVTLRQIIATWVAHDLSHIAQLSRILAKQYSDHVGPFETFLRILKNNPSS